MPNILWRTALAAALVAGAASASAITVGTFNGFEPGNTQGWTSGASGPQPVAIGEGGPGGAADAYLSIVSTGSGPPGGRLVAIAGPDWTGDYAAAGVTGITMDLRNFGSTDLSLRLWLSGPFSAQPVVLAAGGGWQRVLFSTEPAALSPPGSAPLNVNALRLYHSLAQAAPQGADFIAASLGVDNITAVPEPAAVWLMLGGLAFGAWRLRRA